MDNKKITPAQFGSVDLQNAAKAIDRKDFKGLRSMAASGLDVNRTDSDGPSLLVYALARRNRPAMAALLELGANPNLMLGNKTSAMMLAAGAEDPAFLDLLLDHGGDPGLLNDRRQPILFTAVTQQRWKQVEALLKKGASLEQRDTAGRTVLLFRSQIDHFDDAYRLLELGADPLVSNNQGWSLAHYVQDSRLRDDSEPGRWKLKCKDFLIRKGVPYPPAPPRRTNP